MADSAQSERAETQSVRVEVELSCIYCLCISVVLTDFSKRDVFVLSHVELDHYCAFAL